MMVKFDFKEHEKRMRDILNQQAGGIPSGQKPGMLQSLIDKAKTMRKPRVNR